MGEHDDDLEVSPAVEAGVQRDAAHVAAAVASGLEQIAAALAQGFHEVAVAIQSAVAKPKRRPGRRRDRARPAR